MKFSLSLILTVFLLTSVASAETPVERTISAKELKFRYMSNDGSVYLECTHRLKTSGLPDWQVDCGPATALQRHYSVHFGAKEYHHASNPPATLEVLFDITDLNENPVKYYSQAFWLNLPAPGGWGPLILQQSVENDAAVLALTWAPGPQGP